jgi:hypothetical protein
VYHPHRRRHVFHNYACTRVQAVRGASASPNGTPVPAGAPGEGRPQHSLTAADAAPIVDASLIGRPEFDDRTRTIGDTRLHDDRCRLQAQLVDHRRQAEGG